VLNDVFGVRVFKLFFSYIIRIRGDRFKVIYDCIEFKNVLMFFGLGFLNYFSNILLESEVIGLRLFMISLELKNVLCRELRI
jgi:hypothetical protein